MNKMKTKKKNKCIKQYCKKENSFTVTLLQNIVQSTTLPHTDMSSMFILMLWPTYRTLK